MHVPRAGAPLRRRRPRSGAPLSTTRTASAPARRDPPSLLGNSAKLHHVLIKVVDNATKFAPERTGRWTSGASRDGERVALVVRTRAASQKPIRRRIFGRFYRVDKARSRVPAAPASACRWSSTSSRLHSGDVQVGPRCRQRRRLPHEESGMTSLPAWASSEALGSMARYGVGQGGRLSLRGRVPVRHVPGASTPTVSGVAPFVRRPARRAQADARRRADACAAAPSALAACRAGLRRVCCGLARRRALGRDSAWGSVIV